MVHYYRWAFSQTMDHQIGILHHHLSFKLSPVARLDLLSRITAPVRFRNKVSKTLDIPESLY